MEIRRNIEIRGRYHTGFERSVPVSEIIIHGTGGGGSARGIMKWMLDGERADQYRRGVALFHYLIDRDGAVYEIIDPGKWVYHSTSGKHDERTIGVELLNPLGDNGGFFTGEQYGSLFTLMFDDIMEKFPVTIIAGHGKTGKIYSGKYKECPGSAFRWDMLEKEMDGRGMVYTCDTGGELYTDVSQRSP